MTRIQWLTCWDRLRESLSTRTSWGRQQILDEMGKIERAVVREAEEEDNDSDYADLGTDYVPGDLDT